MASDPQNPPPLTWHLVPAEEWRATDTDAPWVPVAFVQDGFIHTTHTAQDVAAAGTQFYKDDPRPYLAVLIDLRQLASPWRYDGNRRFPHIYGALNREAVIAVHPAPRTPDGTFLPPS
jgi:uncharacterized protein (DUF952 family)